MNVIVTPEDVELAEPDNLNQLQVSSPETLTLGTIDTILRRAALGRVDHDHDHAYLDIDALRRRHTELVVTDGADFDQMVGYAAKNGWTSMDGTAVRAHIVRTRTP